MAASRIGRELMKTPDLFAKALETEGIGYICATGEDNLDLSGLAAWNMHQAVPYSPRSARRFHQPELRPIDRQPAACLSTSGPGTIKFVTCAASTPLGSITKAMAKNRPAKANGGVFRLSMWSD